MDNKGQEVTWNYESKKRRGFLTTVVNVDQLSVQQPSSQVSRLSKVSPSKTMHSGSMSPVEEQRVEKEDEMHVYSSKGQEDDMIKAAILPTA